MRSASQQQGGGSVMSNNKEDDEDELEALRLAALESLRAKGLPPPVVMLPGQQQQRLSPKPNVGNNAVFQRHFGNQNLIAIIPVEHSSASSSPYQNSSPHHPPLLDSKATPPSVRSSVRPPLLKDPPSSNLLIHNNSVDEKPKASTKFSRFEDSDSDESDDIEMSFAKSESEEEEFVVEEGDAEDLIIEVEDEVVIEEFTEEVEEPTTSVTIAPDKMEVNTSVAKTSEKYSTRLPQTNTPTPPLRTVEVAKEEPISRDFRNTDINRRLESRDFARRSPKSSSARSSPSHSRRRSSPIRPQRTSPRQRSPVRVQRSPPRAQRSPPRIQRSPQRPQRSPTRSQRSPQRIQRSPPKTHRSPAMVPRSPARTQKSPPRSQRSPVRSSDRDKPKLKESGKTSSGSDRSGSDETKKIDRTRTSMDVNSSRPLDHRRVADKSRSPTSDRKPLLRRSPTRPNPSDREPRKLITPSSGDAERDRLESRKRKFEIAPDLEPPIKKEGKIRLRESSHPTPPLQLRRKEEKPTRNESDHIEIRRDEPINIMHNKIDQDDSDKKMKKNKRSIKKSKEKSRNGKSHSGNEQDNVPVKLPIAKNGDPAADPHVDLRAELQRRRGHRYEEDDEPRSRTPETRRILVLNSPPASAAALVPPKTTTEPTGVLSKHQRLVSEAQSKPSPSDSLAASKRNGSVKLKRTLLATPIEIDQGPETDPLEDRIRLIRAQNELIRQRQREIEADKLQYA